MLDGVMKVDNEARWKTTRRSSWRRMRFALRAKCGSYLTHIKGYIGLGFVMLHSASAAADRVPWRNLNTRSTRCTASLMEVSSRGKDIKDADLGAVETWIHR
jgi:hypothetical protein